MASRSRGNRVRYHQPRSRQNGAEEESETEGGVHDGREGVRLHPARLHQEAGRAVRVRVADALRQAVPEPRRTAPGVRINQAGAHLHGPDRGSRPRTSSLQERAVHRCSHEGNQDRANQPGNLT